MEMGYLIAVLACLAAAASMAFVAVVGYLAYRFRSVRIAVGTIFAFSVVIYSILVLYSYHCLLLAEQNCMPDYVHLEAQHIPRVVVFDGTGWAVAYKTSDTYWQGPGNPLISVNLLGRIVDADPGFVVSAVNKYQGSHLEP